MRRNHHGISGVHLVLVFLLAGVCFMHSPLLSDAELAARRYSSKDTPFHGATTPLFSNTFAIGKALDFMSTLSPEQCIMFEQMCGCSPAPPVDMDVDMDVEQSPSPLPCPCTPASKFYSGTYAKATEAEVLLLTTLLTVALSKNDAGKLSLKGWMRLVESDAARISELGDKWRPTAAGCWNPQSEGSVQRALEDALRTTVLASGGDGAVETASAVLAAWGFANVPPSTIDSYLKRLRMPRAKGQLKGPKYDGKNASPRHVSAIPAMALLLRNSGGLIRASVYKHMVLPSGDAPLLTKAEMVEREAELVVEHKLVVEKLKSKLETMQTKVDTVNKAKSKAQIAAAADRSKVKGTADRVRKEEKGKAKETIKEVRDSAAENADKVLKAKVLRKQELVTAAHAEKRSWKARAEKAEDLAETRLKESKVLRCKNSTLSYEYDELMYDRDEADEGELRKQQLEAWARQQAMPRWHAYRAKGRGGGRSFDVDYRVSIYSAIANQVPLSAIGPTIVDIVRRTAPWLKPEAPSPRMLTEARFELRLIEEALGGRRVALAYAIRMLGFDETTKNGNPGITSNVIIEPTQGAPLVPVLLRGAYCSAGGTSEAIAAAIEKKCFGRLRDILTRWEAMFHKLFPDETWTGPKPKDLSMGRLAGGGALQSDTCNGARKAKRILAEMIGNQAREVIGDEAWGKLTESEQADTTRVHQLDCWQHLRNIFLKEMSSAQAKHVAEELKPHLDAFSSWDRMTTDYTQLLRASYKELHHGNKYYKGKGREFWDWLKKNHPTVFAVHFERAEGGRQDLDYDAAVPLYIMRPYIIEFLHTLVYGANHSNVLEDFLYTSFRSQQYIAMTRANAIIDLTISRPLRWLSGNSHLLPDWSPLSMGRALDLVEQLFVKASTDGSVLLDPEQTDIFKGIAAEQPLFAAYRKFMYEEDHVYSPDGKKKHLIYKLVRDELLNPQDASNVATREKTIKYLEVQCVAGLRKLHDPKLALADKLTSQEGAKSFSKSARAHTDTIGLDATNDRLAESVFGVYDYVLRRCPGISMEAASAVAQAIRSKSFALDGTFTKLPRNEQIALVELARTSVREMRAVDRADHAEHDTYVEAKRKSNSQLELTCLVQQYAYALSFFDRWKKGGVASSEAMRTALDRIPSTQLKLDYLREQIDMRVIGLGFVEFKTAWSSAKEETVGSVSDLMAVLHEILMEEHDRAVCGELPKVAAVPVMKRKSYKELGDPTVQAGQLDSCIKELSPEELLKLAEQRREELEVAGEIDRLGDVMDELPPLINDSIVGTHLEVCWRYWRKPTAAEIAKGEKRKKIGVPIWCEGEIVLVANGTTTKETPDSARCKKLAQAGAVRIRWPEDLDREVPEPEQFTWHILQEATWNQDVHLGWRYTAAELRKRAEASEPARKRRRDREAA